MNIFQKLFSRKQHLATSSIVINRMCREITNIKDYQAFSKEAYAKNVVAFRSINLLSDAVAQIPWLLFKKTGRKERTEITDHPLLDILDKPNSIQSGESFFKFWTAYFLLSGNSFVHAVGVDPENFTTPPKELWNLRPDRMRVLMGKLRTPCGYVWKSGPEKIVFPADFDGKSNILHTKTFNPIDDVYGQSPLEAAAFEIDIHNEGNVWNYSLLKNSASPSGAFVVGTKDGMSGTLTEEQREMLKRDIDETYGGAAKAGKPILLEGGMDWKAMGFNVKEMDFMNSKNVTKEDIALTFGVPGQMVGVKGSQTFANYAMAKEAMYTDTVLPLKNLQKGQLNMWLTPRYGDDLMLDIDEDAIGALEALRERKWKKIKESDWITPNEKREATKYGRYEPTEDPADKIFVNSGQIPLDVAASGFDSDPLEDVEDITGVDDDDKIQQITFLEGKQFNIATEAGKRRHFNQLQRKKAVFERRMAPQVASAFMKERDELINALVDISPSLSSFVIDTVLDETQKDMAAVLKTNIRAIAKSFGEDVLQIGKSFDVDFEKKTAQSQFEFFLNLFVESEATRQIKFIFQSTKKRITRSIKTAIAQSLEEGLSGDVKLGKVIEDLYDGFTPARAKTIARTEVHNASTTASRSAAKSLQSPNMQKEWVSDLQQSARGVNPADSTNHIGMNGKKVPLNLKFDVPSKDGSDQMEGPGDVTAPADQIINCKCVLAYSIKK